MNNPSLPTYVVVHSDCSMEQLREIGQMLRQGGSMSLRDWFAGQALAMLADPATGEQSVSDTAQAMYRIADAMLKAREKATTEEKV